MVNFKDLFDEFNSLKAEIFEQGNFVVIEDSDKMRRYNQLLGFFYPQFRTTDWTSPLK
jgi:hypothetical protein